MIEVDRVVMNSDGDATSVNTADIVYDIKPAVAFKRGRDGWTLGAPLRFEKIAYSLWKDDWSLFSRDMENWIPISKYKEP